MKRQISLCASHVITDFLIYMLFYEKFHVKIRACMIPDSRTVFLALKMEKYAFLRFWKHAKSMRTGFSQLEPVLLLRAENERDEKCDLGSKYCVLVIHHLYLAMLLIWNLGCFRLVLYFAQTVIKWSGRSIWCLFYRDCILIKWARSYLCVLHLRIPPAQCFIVSVLFIQSWNNISDRNISTKRVLLRGAMMWQIAIIKGKKKKFNCKMAYKVI